MTSRKQSTSTGLPLVLDCFEFQVKAVGLVLWEAVVAHMQLLESDYFGLEYTNHNGDEVSPSHSA